MSFSTVHYLIRYNFLCCCRSVPKSCPTLCNPMACSPPGSSTHGMSKQEYWSWVIISFSKDHYFENKKHKTPVQSNTKCSSSWHALAKPNGWSYLLLHVLHRVAGLIKIKMESPSHLTGCECCLVIVRKVVTLQGHRTEGQATVVWRLEEKFLVVRWCLWITSPWIWDIVLISHVLFLCHTVYFRKESCHCLGKNGL